MELRQAVGRATKSAEGGRVMHTFARLDIPAPQATLRDSMPTLDFIDRGRLVVIRQTTRARVSHQRRGGNPET